VVIPVSCAWCYVCIWSLCPSWPGTSLLVRLNCSIPFCVPLFFCDSSKIVYTYSVLEPLVLIYQLSRITENTTADIYLLVFVTWEFLLLLAWGLEDPVSPSLRCNMLWAQCGNSF